VLIIGVDFSELAAVDSISQHHPAHTSWPSKVTPRPPTSFKSLELEQPDPSHGLTSEARNKTCWRPAVLLASRKLMESSVRDEALIRVVAAGGAQKVCRTYRKAFLPGWIATLAKLARSYVIGPPG
jgi:hypothetical protein